MGRHASGVTRDSWGVGIATGAYGLSFGALAVAGGFSLPETCALSLLMFTGGSQFALVSTVSGGGSSVARRRHRDPLGHPQRVVRAQPLVAVAGPRREADRHRGAHHRRVDRHGGRPGHGARRGLGFYTTGIAVFLLWNLATLVGALGARAIGNPADYGLDAAASAAFVALLAPRMKSRATWIVAIGAMAVALVLTPFVPVGIPVLCAALVAVAVGWREAR